MTPALLYTQVMLVLSAQPNIGFLNCSWLTKTDYAFVPGKHVHINAAQKLLSQQFPSIAGLHSTCLSQGNRYEKVTAQSIQIHNTGNFHWVATTSIQLPCSCQAKLFDSRSSGSLTSSLQTQIAQISIQSKHGKIFVEVNPVQQQHALTVVCLPLHLQQNGSWKWSSCMVSLMHKVQWGITFC